MHRRRPIQHLIGRASPNSCSRSDRPNLHRPAVPKRTRPTRSGKRGGWPSAAVRRSAVIGGWRGRDGHHWAWASGHQEDCAATRAVRLEAGPRPAVGCSATFDLLERNDGGETRTTLAPGRPTATSVRDNVPPDVGRPFMKQSGSVQRLFSSTTTFREISSRIFC
jgi:hypothetical protein